MEKEFFTPEPLLEAEPKKQTTVIFIPSTKFIDRKDPRTGSEPLYGGRYKLMVGGDSRLYAAEILAREVPRDTSRDWRIVIAGGPLKNAEGIERSQAETIAEKLKETKHAIPEEKIEALTSFADTRGNMETFLRYLDEKHDQLGEVNEVLIVTEEYHIPRTVLMLLAEIYRRNHGEDLHLPQEIIEREVQPVLEEFLKGADELRTVERLRNIVEPYVGILPFRITPKSSALVLQEASEKGARYASMLRKQPYLATLRQGEVNGIIALLSGRYRRTGKG